jgi:hypothetical protein
MTDLICYRYNTMAAESSNGEWTWRVILGEPDGFNGEAPRGECAFVQQEDVMPVVGRKYHMACRGVFRLEDGTGIIDPS